MFKISRSSPRAFRMVFALVAVGAAATARPCRAIHFDYLIEQNAYGQLVTGSNNFDTNTESIPDRLFYRDIDTNFFGSDPGFSAVSQANVPAGYFALPPSAPVSFTMAAMPLYASEIANLWYWDGTGDVNFQPMTTGTTLTLSFGLNHATVDGSAVDVPGFTLQTTDANGAIHRHPNYQLAGGPGGVPAEGMYMFAETVSVPGLKTSIPFYTMFVTDAISSPVYNEAVQWGHDHLLLPGDVNNDGVVNAADLTVIASHWLQNSLIGDANYDGIVNAADITIVASHWLQTSADINFALGASTAVVPEPASAVLAACAACGVALLYRRRAARASRSRNRVE